jgi:serine/threonine protein kinase
MTGLTGQTLGRYLILERLGEGGMAVVYKARDTQLERLVAIKLIRLEMLRGGEEGVEQAEISLKRFKREARLLAKLSHPNILTVLDYGQHENQVYLISSYLPGGSLKARLNRPMPWREASQLAYSTARALEYAHGMKILHRDIKPANILLTSDGTPVLADFGLAKMMEHETKPGGSSNTSTDVSQLTQENVSVGTPDYMAPEQCGGIADFRSDVYALGVVYYEMVTGRVPFLADTPLKVLLMHASEPLPPPRSLAPGLPADLERILTRALEKEPEDRFQNMAEFAAAIHACLYSSDDRTRAFEADDEPCLQAQGGEVFALKPEATVIGRRDSKVTVRVDIDLAPFDARKIVSRRHAVIEKKAGGFLLVDQNSVNGTWINDQRLDPRHPHPLKEGDVISFGRKGVQMRFGKR